MSKYFLTRQRSLISFEHNKPGTGVEQHPSTARRLSGNRRLTQLGFGTCSSSTLMHLCDPAYVH
jgi:hypothetical protein